jgi:hypothetical protein
MSNSLRKRSLSCTLVVAFFLVPLAQIFAQGSIDETEEYERESLREPVVIPSNTGIYQGLQELPESIRKSKQFGRDMHLLKMRVGNGSEYNYEARIEAHAVARENQLIEARRDKGSQKEILANAWTNVGPNNGGATGGMTAALAVNPRKPATIYAGAGGGGVWKSYNSGGNWFALTDEVIPDLAVATLAINPVDTNMVFVGTGNAFSAIRGLGGSGVYRTKNGGASWQRVGSSVLKGSIAKVFVHPKQPDIVFASGYDDSRGIYRSTNGGDTWTKVLAFTSSTRVWDIAPASVFGTDVVLYAVAGNGNTTEGGVYKSINNGLTWTKITGGGLPSGELIGRAGFGISTKTPERVWILMATTDGNLQGLWRSTNSGTSFTKLSNTPTTVFRPNTNFAPQGWYDLMIGVTPNSTSNDTVFIGGVEGWYSHDGGQNWEMFAGYADLPSSAPHVDIHCIAFDPNSSQNAYLGCDGGIYRSLSGGASWSYRSTGYVTHRYYRLGLQTSDAKVSWTGAQDQGIWKHVTATNSSFRGLGDGFQVALNPQNPNEVLALGPGGDLYRSASGGGASSFVYLGSQFTDGADWDAPLRFGNKSPYTRYLGRASLWKSADGTSWSKTTGSSGFTNSSPIRSIAVNPANNNIVWVGGYDKVMKSTNNGTDWTATGNVPSAVITSIQLGSDANFAVISVASQSTSTARVMVTTDGGTSWVNKSGSGTTALPAAICWSVALDSINPKSIWYAATDFGMYYTRDGGATWGVAGSGIGMVPCWDVQLHPNKATLRVATFGRGLWEANTNVLPVEISSLVAIPRDVHTELKWTTDSERNTWRFVVRRSFNYSEFEEIGELPAAGESNTRKFYVFNDPKIDTGSYIYQIKTIDLDGSESFSNFVEVHRGDAGNMLRLDQNYPNPFFLKDQATVTPTRIRFYLPTEDHVTLKIFSSNGQLVHSLLNGSETMNAGENNVFWDGRDEQGITVAAGAYFYVLETSKGEQIWNKMIVFE